MRLSIKIIIVEEARDEAKKEQITIILWFFWQWWFHFIAFFHIVHVKDITLTLKQEMCNVLSLYNLLVEHIWGQWYDDANNMRGE
jgi:heme/copper-type cytochrome/quinol oxidase subunit 4